MHPLLSRRHFLSQTATGLGGIALTHLLGRDQLLAATAKGSIRPDVNPANPNAARRPMSEANRRS